MKTGELLMLSTECYSDLRYEGPFEVIKDFSIVEMAKKVAESSPIVDWQSKNGPDNVAEFLVSEGYIKKVPCKNFHLGSYGQIEVTGDIDD